MSRRECVFWGWGEPGAGPSLPDHAAGFLRSELGVDGRGGVAPGRRWRRCGCGRRRCRERRASAPGRDLAERCATTPPRASAAAAASPTSTCCASARATARTRPTRCVAPGDAPPRSRRCSTPAARRAWRSCRSAAARASSAGSSRCAARYDALVSLDLGRLEGIESFDERSQLAWLRGGTRLPGGRPRARPARLHARPHAAELRVGDGRRLRGDALGRPVLDRARADRGERRRAALRDARRRAREPRRCRPPRRGRR